MDIRSDSAFRSPPRADPFRISAIVLLASLIGLSLGCATTDWVKLRKRPALPLARELGLFSLRGPQPTARTQQLLRRYDLLETWQHEPAKLLEELLAIKQREPAVEHVFAVAEMAYISGQRAQQRGRLDEALDLYAISVAHAYHFLLNEQFDEVRNPFDPQFRQASDIYNGALESALRIVASKGNLHPNGTHLVATGTQEYQLAIVCRGPWEAQDIAALKFVSDYRVQGLKNHYRTFGLGVPLIAVHSRQPGRSPAEAYYAPGMSFATTAFLRVNPLEQIPDGTTKQRLQCVLELHDPLVASDLWIDGQRVPLETDLSTPLAYSLSDPTFQQVNGATRGLLDATRSQEVQGLYLLEPYDPNKIPVLMIHGIWSNLVTWMEMFNDLRGTPEIRDHYQFWFYLYPTGQPFWITAAQLRQELAEARQTLDPSFQSPALDQAVLVGHSMGGLIARLQTLESRDDFWRLISDEPISQLEAPDDVETALRRVMFFGPSPSVRRVVTIASPHRGSSFSNSATQWLGRRIIQLPESFLRVTEQLAHLDRKSLPEAEWLHHQTSIDALSPTSPFLSAMMSANSAPWVRYHNVVGRIAEERFWSKVAGQGDGVVQVDSAHLEQASSELVVDADHVNIHRHPRTVLEVQRILLEHWDEVQRTAMQPRPAASLSRLPQP